jgi:23S rRNA (guanosine2251-2'-O)-methyltransferase
MRESYRDKKNRQARIAREKEEYIDRRKDQRRKDDRRQIERRSSDRRQNDRREALRGEFDRRIGERRQDTDRRFVERRDFEDRRKEDSEDNSYEDIVAGRNAVLELLKSDKDINKLFIERGEKHGSINEIIARAKENKVVTVEVDKSKLDQMAENNQGVVAIVPPFNYCEIEDILALAKEKNEDPFILILDGIEDPHNLGSIIRTAETAGVHGIIIPKRRNVAVNSTVVKVSTGATSYVKIARVNNINDSIRKLKDAGLWVIGTDGDAQTLYYNQDLKGPLAIIIGSEGFGMSKLVKENADLLIKIPMKGKITSLNASVSAGIVIYEAVKQRI